MGGRGGGKKGRKTTGQERYHVVVNDDGSGVEKEERGEKEKRGGESEKLEGKDFGSLFFPFGVWPAKVGGGGALFFFYHSDFF